MTLRKSIHRWTAPLSFGLISLLLPPASFALAQEPYAIERLPGIENTISRDFVVGPGKIEVSLDPGTSRTVELRISNRLGERKAFSLDVEDFTGSNDPLQPVVLLGERRGPYSLKDYLSFPSPDFSLNHGERAVVPVTITVPADAEPGGRYGSVLVSIVSNPLEDEAAQGAAIVSRIGSLFFVTVRGDIERSGHLEDFSVSKPVVWDQEPISFGILYENEGNIHVNPYGAISVKNIFGEEIGFIPVDPWFAMPHSLRLREVMWERGFLFGRYTATAAINRGYNDVVDEKSVTFYVFPWGIVLPAFGGIILLILLLKFVSSRFTIARK